MDIIFSASIIAAFIAGMVALFAPCCITVLLPSYLASAFREKKHILKMTFIFFAGISVILIPIGLGAAWLAKIFQSFHYQMYITGGVLMIILAVLSVLGKGLAIIPMPKRLKPKVDAAHPKSVFLLGMFSGAATSCCAPVLAGAVTLAVLSGGFWKALVVTFVYVFGMTFPLFITAYFYDKFKLAETNFIKGKLWEVNIAGRQWFFHSTNLLAGVVFLVMGSVMLWLGLTGDAYWAPGYQVKIGQVLNTWSFKLVSVAQQFPEAIWGLIIIGIFGYLVYQVKKMSKES